MDLSLSEARDQLDALVARAGIAAVMDTTDQLVEDPRPDGTLAKGGGRYRQRVGRYRQRVGRYHLRADRDRRHHRRRRLTTGR